MQFRERRRVIQVIRTTYDPELKRGRSEVVGKIDKAAPGVTDKLQKTCTADELSEISTYLANRQNMLRTEAVRAGAETLPAQMRAAAEYFRTHRDGEARVFAAEIRAAWDDLKGSLRKAGFSKSKVLKQRGERVADKAADKAASAKVAVKEPPRATEPVEAPKAEAAQPAAPVKPRLAKPKVVKTPEPKTPTDGKPAARKPVSKRPISGQPATAPVALSALVPAPDLTVEVPVAEKPDTTPAK